MPTYEYECEACGYRFEQLQSMNAAPLKKCPRCGRKLRRLIGTGTGVIFKGTGFYATDYKQQSAGRTCCGRTERCERPPCAEDGSCKR